MPNNVIAFGVEIDTGGGFASIASYAYDATVSLGTEQDHGAATVTFDQPPAGIDEGVPIVVKMGKNGSTSTVFNGEIVGITWEQTVGLPRVTLECQDIMARLSHPWANGYYDYTAQDDAAIIQNLIEKSGISPSLTSIQSSSWTVPYVELRDGTPDVDGGGASDTPLAIIREIDKVALHWTATRSNGAIYRRPIAIGTPNVTIDVDSDDGIRSIRRTRTKNGIINSVTVKGEAIIAGFGIEQRYQASNSYLPYPVDYNSEVLQTNLLDNDVKALAVATAYVTMKNIRPETIELVCDGRTDFEPGYTMRITSYGAGGISARDYFVTAVDHRMGGGDYTTTVRGMRLG